MDIIFRNNEHKERYYNLLMRMRNKDEYHIVLAYLFALPDNMHVEDVYDFQEDGIIPEGVSAPWQTSSTHSTTRLAFNLWNWRSSDSGHPDDSSWYYTPAHIFSNINFAPYFYQAIRLMYGF